jgi:hypothetical protein
MAEITQPGFAWTRGAVRRVVVWNWGKVIIYRERGSQRNDACTLDEWAEWFFGGLTP